MQLDYSLLLDNIKRRRYDEAIRKYVLSPSFFNEEIPKCVRYAHEAMLEIDSSYAYKVYANARRIHETISRELKQHNVNTMIRYQGALRTDTHVRLYGEVDLLFLLDEKATHKDVFALGQMLRDIASRQNHQTLDYGDGVRIRLVTNKPNCRINLIPCAWINNQTYVEKRNEIYRGIVVYNFKDKTRKKHLPFLNIGRMNAKDTATNGGFKYAVRLVKSLSTDDSIALNAYELSSLIYRIEDDALKITEKQELKILPAISNYLEQLLADKQGFEMLLSPSEKELVFGERSGKREVVGKLLSSVNQLIGDLKEHVGENLDKEIAYDSEVTSYAESE
jgi:hypothetical protein